MTEARLVALTLWGLFLVGCDAHIDQFAASAHYICVGQKVDLDWQVTGSAKVKVTPPLAALRDGKIDSTGRATIFPTQTTAVELDASRCLGHPTSSIQTIRVVAADDAPKPLTASVADPDSAAGCADGQIWATVHALRFTPDIRVATVAEHSGDQRTYQVKHAGVSASVGPGVTATAFAGTPIVGDWLLTSPLGAGEACGTATLPHNLVVDVFLQCQPGGSP